MKIIQYIGLFTLTLSSCKHKEAIEDTSSSDSTGDRVRSEYRSDRSRSSTRKPQVKSGNGQPSFHVVYGKPEQEDLIVFLRELNQSQRTPEQFFHIAKTCDDRVLKNAMLRNLFQSLGSANDMSSIAMIDQLEGLEKIDALRSYASSLSNPEAFPEVIRWMKSFDLEGDQRELMSSLSGLVKKIKIENLQDFEKESSGLISNWLQAMIGARYSHGDSESANLDQVVSQYGVNSHAAKSYIIAMAHSFPDQMQDRLEKGAIYEDLMLPVAKSIMQRKAAQGDYEQALEFSEKLKNLDDATPLYRGCYSLWMINDFDACAKHIKELQPSLNQKTGIETVIALLKVRRLDDEVAEWEKMLSHYN